MKRILALTLCVLSLLSLAACGAKTAAEPVSLTLTNTLPDDEYAVDALGAFADAVWEATDETVTIEVQEGGEQTALDALRAGTVDMTVLSYETMCALHEEWKAYSMPYLFLTREDYWDAMDSDATRALYDLTAPEGFVGLTWLDAGSRCFYTASKEITAPADLQGLRIGSAKPELVRDLIETLGAECVPMDYDAIPAAIAAGEIDGAEDNVLAMFDYTGDLGYLIYDDHVRAPRVVVISNAALERLSDSQRDALRDKANEMSEYYKAFRVGYEDEGRAEAQDEHGAELVRKVDREAFRAACAPVYDALRESGSPAAAIVESFIALQK